MSDPIMKAIVFGASGYLGSHVVEQLLLEGHEVTAAFRDTIDFSDTAQLQRAIAGHEVVFCCLANRKRHLPIEGLREVEVGLSSALLQAAAEAGARRFVLLSTVMVYGFSRPARAIDETYPPRPDHNFCRVALEREQTLARVAANLPIELTILRPANAIGRRDVQMARLFQSHRAGFYPVFGSGETRFSGIDARDVGRAMALLGVSPAAAGQVYLSKAYDSSWLELKRTLDEITGTKARVVKLPVGAMRWLGGALETLLPYSLEPALTRFSVDVMSTHTLFDSRKIEALGFHPRYTLADAVLDYLQGAA